MIYIDNIAHIVNDKSDMIYIYIVLLYIYKLMNIYSYNCIQIKVDWVSVCQSIRENVIHHFDQNVET